MATIDWGDLVTVQPSEVIETRMPLVVEYSRLQADSGGAGTSRGGLAMCRRIRLAAPDARYSLLADGAVLPAFGVLGGRSGMPVASWIEHADGRIEDFDTPGKIGGHQMVAGDRVVLRSAGGGGYGDPLEREPERVADDLRLGYISADVARQIYGVVIAEGGTVDAAQTARLRRKIKMGRFMPQTVAEADGYRKGATSKRRICRLNPADAGAARLGEGDIVEVDAYRAAPFRAWVVPDGTVQPGTVPIDAVGLGMLRVAVGERVEVRLLRRADATPRTGVLG
jgi:N-methylhydantoinase B